MMLIRIDYKSSIFGKYDDDGDYENDENYDDDDDDKDEDSYND